MVTRALSSLEYFEFTGRGKYQFLGLDCPNSSLETSQKLLDEPYRHQRKFCISERGFSLSSTPYSLTRLSQPLLKQIPNRLPVAFVDDSFSMSSL